MDSFRKAWGHAFSGNQTSHPDNNTPNTTTTSLVDHNPRDPAMDDPLSMMANQAQQKRQSSNTLLNEMEDLDNRVIPHALTNNKSNGKSNKNNKSNNKNNKKANRNVSNNNTSQNGSSKKHYRSISHNTSTVSPNSHSNNSFAAFTNQQRKSSYVQ